MKKIGYFLADCIIFVAQNFSKFFLRAGMKEKKIKKKFKIHPFVPILEKHLAEFEDKTDWGLYTDYQKNEIIKFIKARTKDWIEFFRWFVFENDLHYQSKPAKSIFLFEAVMSSHIKRQKEELYTNQNIDKIFLDNFYSIIYPRMYKTHREDSGDIIKRHIFSSHYEKWYHLFLIFTGSIKSLNLLVLKRGYTLFKKKE